AGVQRRGRPGTTRELPGDRLRLRAALRHVHRRIARGRTARRLGSDGAPRGALVNEVLALIALVAALVAAVVRERRAAEAAVALGGAAILIAADVLSWGDARAEAGDLAPTLVVLAALLVLGDGCERAGLFDALAARMAAGARGSGVRLLGLVFAAA